MEITKIGSDNGEIMLEIKGRITAIEEEELGAAINAAVSETKRLKLDFKDVDYLSSAGLRTLVSAKKQMDANGGMITIINAAADVREVFEMTGLADMFGI
ncbi:MAG: STAS domain-containing protein [Endomicrobia bacterium]|nr:STAS domain-containing protein [Endomicrobiia bacterium]MCL2799263.1 STAS domain-containing protein [Endomicrobiia bacterium]